jgi:sugar lactone lactonase YvrE
VTDNSIGKTVVRFGPAGEDLGVFSDQLTFSAPADAALLGEQVIVVDTDQNPRLFRFATDGSFLGAFPQESAAELLVNPIAADADAELLLVVDGLLNVVVRLLPTGELFDAVGAAELGAISDVAVLPDGSFVVADRGDEERQIGGGLRVFGPAGNLVQQISLPELEGLAQPRVISAANLSARPLR